MGAPAIRSWTRALLPLSLLARQVSGGALAAWWTDRIGATLLMQDDDTGLIRYSLCDSKSTPVLPEDKSITLPLFDPKPKKGSALAGVGWYDGTQTQASIWFQDENDDIINSLLHCDMSTGYWLHGGSWVISGDAKSPSPNTTIGAVVLGATTGYRVFYRDVNHHLRYIGYVPNSSGWGDYGSVSNDAIDSSAIGVGFTEGNNITVVTPKNQENMEIMRLNDDNSWHINTFPRPLNASGATNATNATDFQLNTQNSLNYTLPGWDGQPSSLGIGIDSKDMRSVFYIGADNALYQVAAADDANATWTLLSRQDEKTWPPADRPKAPLAVASNYGRGELRVYYVSGGQVVEVNGDGRKWQAAKALPNYNKTLQAAAGGNNSSSSSTAADGGGGDSGLSTGGKVGVGVGVGLGALAGVGAFAALLCMRKRQRRADEAEGAAANQEPHGGGGGGGVSPLTASSPSQGNNYGYTPHQQQQQQQSWVVNNKPVEKDSPPIYEMPENRPRHEMMGEGHYREVP